MKTVSKLLTGLFAILLVVGVGGYAWATVTSSRVLSRTFAAHSVDFPIPFPLSEEETDESALSEEQAQALALERAIERGRHLVEARYACTECHGTDLSGGVMVDAFPIGTLLGPNITGGEGSRIAEYGPVEWDRIVRHGILPDGRPATMPSEDFQLMSDQELSDVVAFVLSHPPVNNTVSAPTLGPLGKILVATGQLPLSADLIEAHTEPHAQFPPATAASAEFGQHLAGTCMGCHGEDFSGGPIPGGDPSWVPARNLTPAPAALGGWSYEDFEGSMRGGIRPDGTALRLPMTLVTPYAQSMTDIELRALWLYLQSIPAVSSAS